MTSIRKSLTLNLLLGLFVLFAACGAALYTYTQRALVYQFDANLLVEARLFSVMSELESAEEIEEEEEEGSVDFEFAEAKVPEYEPSPNAQYYQVWNEQNDVVLRSPSLLKANLPSPKNLDGVPQYNDIVLPDGRAGRTVAFRFWPRTAGEHEEHGVSKSRAPEPMTLVMARSRKGMDHTLQILVAGFVATALILAIGASLAVGWSVRTGLRPLERVAAEAESISAESLDHHFAIEGLPNELAPVCVRLNSLLERLDAAFRRERRFTGDAAHELRTPLSELRTLSEVGLNACIDSGHQEFESYFRDALEIAIQMERLVGTLLDLARGQSGATALNIETLDLTAVINEVLLAHEEHATSRNVLVETNFPSRAHIETDRTILTAVLSNLCSNAIMHSPEGSTVQLEGKVVDHQFTLTLTNPCNALTQEDLTHFFEPFWRKDKARSDRVHLGIGLSVAQAYAKLLQGEITVILPKGTSVQVCLRFPVM